MFRCVAGVGLGAVIAIANISAAASSPTVTTMREGGYALAPFSFVKFCLDYPGDCPKSAGPGRIHLTSRHMAELANVNRAVNAAIRPTPDASAMRFWRLNVSAGDCNSYAVEKRHELIRRGWPAAALALTVAKTSWGEGHLVVTVRTDQGDLVLDNLRSSVIPWEKTGYDWIMRQSELNPQFWVELDGGEAGTMTAAADFGAAAETAEPDEADQTADDATDARRPIGVGDVRSADAGLTRVGAARLAPTQGAKADAPAPAREAAKTTMTAAPEIGFAQAAVLRSPDVAALEAEAAGVALAEGQRQAARALSAAAPLWMFETREISTAALDNLAAALDRWFAASGTASSTPASEDSREAASADLADLADLRLRGFI